MRGRSDDDRALVPRACARREPNRVAGWASGSKGFTLAEVIIVIAILGTLGAIAYPIYRRSVNKSKEVACIEQMKQLQEAIQLYRSDFDGQGKYGKAEEMGMPNTLAGLYVAGYVKLPLLQCNAGPKMAFGSMFAWSADDYGLPSWEVYSGEARENSIILVDGNHGNEGKPIYSKRITYHALGVYLDGHAVTKTKKGIFAGRLFWN
ncbi:MAG TPA: type II secretion system protein [Fimbriimonadales bacterium]|nr:type II secretion system protein [Fimbriimonadales bacterium]